MLPQTKSWKMLENKWEKKKNIMKCWAGSFTALECQWALWKGINISTVSDPEYDCTIIKFFFMPIPTTVRPEYMPPAL